MVKCAGKYIRTFCLAVLAETGDFLVPRRQANWFQTPNHFGKPKPGVPNPACRLEKNPLVGLEAQRSWGPPDQMVWWNEVMHASVTLRTEELPEFLLNVAVARPVFVWGQPGIGKSSLVQGFAESLGLPCVSLLGTQLAPEDLIGVPQIVDGKSRFCPPTIIAREDPYCLFLDELNGASQEVQKAFYSLILERRIGEFKLHDGSIVIGAGNRAQDSAIVKTMSSALINRTVHVHLLSSPSDWLQWGAANGIHPWVYEYIRLRPDHLTSPAPKHEEPFSTPRSWHMLSDTLHSFGEAIRIGGLRCWPMVWFRLCMPGSSWRS